MIDETRQETYDRTEPPGPKRSDKPPKYFDYLGKQRKLMETPPGELKRIFGTRPLQPQF